MRKFSLSLAPLFFLFSGHAEADQNSFRDAIPTPHMIEAAESATSLNSIAENLSPLSRIPRSEFSGCKSETKQENVTFRNIGSMCVDGLFSLMEGRGCDNIMGARDPSGRWTYHRCESQPTCDNLHSNTFAVVPVGISISENFDEHAQVWCTDSNYVIVKM
tara:strand:+ start:338 stop:820 length:483 start_codon:yes stop_codon:yes gene_type:complete